MACLSIRAEIDLTMSETIRSSQVGIEYLLEYRLIAIHISMHSHFHVQPPTVVGFDMIMTVHTRVYSDYSILELILDSYL